MCLRLLGHLFALHDHNGADAAHGHEMTCNLDLVGRPLLGLLVNLLVAVVGQEKVEVSFRIQNGHGDTFLDLMHMLAHLR